MTSALRFLDSTGQATEKSDTSKIQPWRVLWPPKEGSPLHLWMKSNCPEALFYQFDPACPFDRPWKQWAKFPLANVLSCAPPTPSKSNEEEQPVPIGNAMEIESQSTSAMKASIVPKTANEKLDTHWDALELPQTLACLYHLAPLPVYQHEKPFVSRLPYSDPTRDLVTTNIATRAYDNISICDVSGVEDAFRIEECGFQYVRSTVPSDIGTWDEKGVRDVYLPHMEAWLKDRFQCRMVRIYTYNFHSNDRARTPTEPWMQPFMRTHCDATRSSGFSRLALHIPDELASSTETQERVRLIGVWRPLTGPEQDYPLAVCDTRTVSESDLVPADIVFPHYCDERYELLYSPAQRWFYKRRMQVDEVILLKHFDSNADEATFSPHTAFLDRDVGSESVTRASIELKAILIG
ncbi:hypothetical protein BU16DRAFT_97500 [Lophium mytilinum]|uniref:Methyltransferase n=1 Tax=Lophium mytilinum TaxID=390894 RepID=A0A6A6QLD9_9PEZI|nr:hypothetical protein BU16DRAFT_97500 [Lophium mytilinum]